MKIEFINYTGECVNWCRGILTLKLDGLQFTFGDNKKCDYPRFWRSGGGCNFDTGEVYEGKWQLDWDSLPEDIQPFGKELIECMNNNVKFGCCGGCI